MKYIKMLGLLVVAAAALMAFAGPASATLTEAAGDPVDVGDTIHTTSQSAWILGPITVNCKHSTKHFTITSNGSVIASSTVSSMWFSECGNHTVTVKNGGSLEINNKNQIFSTGAEVTVLTHSAILGTVHCIFTTNETDIGDLTGGTTAVMDIASESIPVTATDGFCGEHATWEGSYIVNTPDTLLVD